MPTDPSTLLAATLIAAGVLAEYRVLRMFLPGRGRRGALAGAAAMAALFAVPAAAQDTPMAEALAGPVLSTDRPSFSDGTGIVPPGRWNLESGCTVTVRDRGGIETRRLGGPEVLVRAGLVDDRVEFRLLTPGAVLTRTDEGTGPRLDEGWSDCAIGLKVKLWDQDGWRPRVAVGVQSTLGTGSDGVTGGVPEPTIKLLWSTDLGIVAGDRWNGWTLGGNLNAAWTISGGERLLQGQASLYASLAVTPEVSAFAEVFALAPAAAGEGASCSADAGVSWLVTRRVQVDARVGFGITREADDAFVGAGVSFLF